MDDKNQTSSGSGKQAKDPSPAPEDMGRPSSRAKRGDLAHQQTAVLSRLLRRNAPRNDRSTSISFSKRSDNVGSHTRNRATWRTACTFSLLALLTMMALTRGNWPFTGPTGTLAESILRAAVWLSIFTQCTTSVYLASAALKRSRRDRDRVRSALAAIALFIGVVVILLVYSRLWI